MDIMDAVMQNINITLPVSDMKFFKELVKKMGWTIEKKKRQKSAYEVALDDVKHGRVCKYNSLDDFIKEIESE